MLHCPPLPRCALAVGLLTLALGSPVALAADEISTDRPDFVESSAVVGKGRVQIETSVAGERDNAGGVKTRTTSTPTLLRVGVSDSLELRLETDGYMRTTSRDQASGAQTRERGWADVALGVKWHVQDGDEAKGTPSTAWLLHADLDSGSGPFRGQGIRPSARFVAEWELPGEVSVGIMPGVVWDRTDTGRRYLAGIAAITAAKGWTERFRTFVEWAGQHLASGRNGGSTITVDVGAAWLLSDSVQLDTALSFGVNKQTPDLAWTVGISARF